jgi:hypothetical protein
MLKLIKLSKAKSILGESCFAKDSIPSHATIISWIEEGFLPGKRIGLKGNWYIFDQDLENFIKRLQSRQLGSETLKPIST